MQSHAIILMIFAVPLLIGCRDRSVEDRSFSAQELAGEYDYYRQNLTTKPLGTSCFTLHADGTFSSGTADLTSADGPVLPKAGRWTIDYAPQGPGLDLAHTGFPLERHHSSIRAAVNEDLGMFCQLSK